MLLCGAATAFLPLNRFSWFITQPTVPCVLSSGLSGIDLVSNAPSFFNSQAVFFKMRVAGVLHIFQFESKQGEDICMALQTHINDIMMKRYSKAKAAQEGGDGGGGGE